MATGTLSDNELLDRIGQLLQLQTLLGDLESAKRESIEPFLKDVLLYDGVVCDSSNVIRVMRERDPVMIVDCKSRVGSRLTGDSFSDAALDYYALDQVRFMVLTDGLSWRFHSDTLCPPELEKEPFLAFDIDNFDQGEFDALRMFGSDMFDKKRNVELAYELQVRRLVKAKAYNELAAPSRPMVDMFVKSVKKTLGRRCRHDSVEELTERFLPEILREIVERGGAHREW